MYRVPSSKSVLRMSAKNPKRKSDSKSASTRGAGSSKPNEDYIKNIRKHTQTYIEESAFPLLTDIIDRIQRSNGCLGAQQDWLNSLCPPNP